MAPVALSFVVRFSSEDVIFKAENLCKGKAGAAGTWKIAKEDTNCGRLEAEFQLEKASYISHIDIGNCGSAFIEILVGNSMWPQDKPYVTLLPSAMLMSPAECKHWTKTHTVRMFNQSAFSKQARGSQWDRIRVICRQPYRNDKQFGLSFMRMGSVPDDPAPSPPEEAFGKGFLPTVQHSDDETDEDGVMRLKKASGLMGCLRNLEKGSPEIPLNRAGKMLQAALDSRSPGTPRNVARNKRLLSQSSPEISSSPESPFKKRNSQSPCEGPGEKKKKKEEKKWSLSGDIRDEVALFLEEIDFIKMDLEKITFKDLRSQMEEQRGCSLTKQEKKVFLELAKAAIEKLLPAEDDPEDVLELSVSTNDSPTLKKTVAKEPKKTKKRSNKSSTITATSQEKATKNTKPSSPQPSTSTVSPPEIKSQGNEKPPAAIPIHEIQDVDFPRSSSEILVGDNDEELPSMLYSSEEKKPTRKELLFPSSPVKDKSPTCSPTSFVECPLCNRFFPAKEVEFHASFCVGDTSPSPNITEPEVELMQCPICSKSFPVTQIEQHANECVEAAISESSRSNMRREPLAI